MKILKLFIFLTFLFFQNQLQAQPNPFFPMENGFWEEASINWGGNPIKHYTFTYGDTIINNEVHAKIYEVSINPFSGNISEQLYRGATITSADQVHIVYPDSTDSILLYDFSLEMGESIEFEIQFLGPDFISTLTVVGNSLMTDNAGISRRVIILDNDGFIETWIEGIGSSRGLLDRGVPPLIDWDHYMNCFKYEDILLWSNETTMPACDFSFTELIDIISSEEHLLKEKVDFQISPNPLYSEGFIQIEGLDLLEAPEIRIYNLQGQLIQKIMELNEENFSFFRNKLNAGMYVFELFDTKTTFAVRKKVIVNDER